MIQRRGNIIVCRRLRWKEKERRKEGERKGKGRGKEGERKGKGRRKEGERKGKGRKEERNNVCVKVQVG